MVQVALTDRLPAHRAEICDVPSRTVAKTAPFLNLAAVGVDPQKSDLEEFQVAHGYRRQKVLGGEGMLTWEGRGIPPTSC